MNFERERERERSIVGWLARAFEISEGVCSGRTLWLLYYLLRWLHCTDQQVFPLSLSLQNSPITNILICLQPEWSFYFYFLSIKTKLGLPKKKKIILIFGNRQGHVGGNSWWLCLYIHIKVEDDNLLKKIVIFRILFFFFF